MGQKVNPNGFRLGVIRTWDSRWYEKKNYKIWLHEDASIRKFFNRMTRAAAISKIEIERRAQQTRVIVHTAKPGIIIGKRGVGIEDIRLNLERLTKKNVQVNVVEIKHPELDARLVGQNIVDQLEKRIAFRRAMKQSIMRTMKAGARGVKVMVSGRLGGSEIARTEQNHDGKVPLHTLRADIDYANVEAFTTFGRIGVKVWIYRGEVLPDAHRAPDQRDGRDRGPRGGRDRRSGGGTPRERRQEAVAVEAQLSGDTIPAAIAEAPEAAPLATPVMSEADVQRVEAAAPEVVHAEAAAVAEPQVMAEAPATEPTASEPGSIEAAPPEPPGGQA
jgi:small subunit ribosomal protein S3